MWLLDISQLVVKSLFVRHFSSSFRVSVFVRHFSKSVCLLDISQLVYTISLFPRRFSTCFKISLCVQYVGIPVLRKSSKVNYKVSNWQAISARHIHKSLPRPRQLYLHGTLITVTTLLFINNTGTSGKSILLRQFTLVKFSE